MNRPIHLFLSLSVKISDLLLQRSLVGNGRHTKLFKKNPAYKHKRGCIFAGFYGIFKRKPSNTANLFTLATGRAQEATCMI